MGVSLLVTAFILWIVELVGVRPMRRMSGSMGWVVSTLGIGIFLQGMASWLFGTQAVAFPDVLFSSADTVEFMGAYISLQYIAVFVISVMIVCLMELFLRHSIWGYGCARWRTIATWRP